MSPTNPADPQSTPALRDAVEQARTERADGPRLVALLCGGALAAAVADPAQREDGDGILHRLIGTAASQPGATASLQDASAALAAGVEAALAADPEQVRLLRREIADAFGRRGIPQEALKVALDLGDEAFQQRLLTELGSLAGDITDFGALLGEVRRTLDSLQDGLQREETVRRTEDEDARRQATRLRLIREQLAGIERRLDDAAAGPRTMDLRGGAEPPYRGLWPFQEDQADVFHGRTRLTADLTGHVEACLSSSGMVMVTGASGAGKSSLVRAGLLPAIAKGQLTAPGSRHWPRLIATPGRSPVDGLAYALSSLTGVDPGSIRNTLRARPDQAYLYARQAVFTQTDGLPSEQRDLVRETGRLLVFVDQFEELFTLVRDERERRAFIAALHAIASGGDRPSGVVVIGVRGDFIDRCATMPALVPVLQRHAFVVGPPEPEELRQVITGPAAAAGLRLDDGLADDILADLRATSQDGGFTAGALPLLSQTMLSIWQRREGSQLTRRAYAELGGIGRAIEASAEDVYRRLPPPLQAVTAELFRRLVLVDRRGTASRRQASRTHLAHVLPGSEAVIGAYTASRLLALTGDTVEIAHDVLLRSWGRLDTWLHADRMHRAILAEVADDADEWLRHGRDASFLYQGARFETVERARRAWESDPDAYPELAGPAREFLERSRRHETRRRRTRRIVAAALGLLLLVSIGTAGIAVAQYQAASSANAAVTDQRNRALAINLAAASEEAGATDGELARSLAALAWRLDQSQESRGAMITAMESATIATLSGHSDKVLAIDVSTDGAMIATGGRDRSVILWDRESLEPVLLLDGHGGEVTAIRFSPDGSVVATGANNGDLHWWDTATGERLGHQRAHDAKRVVDLAYAPDGDLLASGGDDSVVRVWDTETYTQVGRYEQDGEVKAVAFSSDGHRVWAVSGSEALRRWSVADGTDDPATANDLSFQDFSCSPVTQLCVIAESYDAWLWRPAGDDLNKVYNARPPVQASPDGTVFAARHADGGVGIWTLNEGVQVNHLPYADEVLGMAFADGGDTLAVTIEDGAVLFDVRSEDSSTRLPEAQPLPGAVAFSGDGSRFAAAGTLGVQSWDLDTGELLFDVDSPIGDLFLGVIDGTADLSPDGSLIAVGGRESHDVWMFDAATGERVGELPHANAIGDVEFSPDGTTIATAAAWDNLVAPGERELAVRLWDAETFEPIGKLDDHEQWLVSVGWSRDSERIVTVDGANTVRVWDVAAGTAEVLTGNFGYTSDAVFDPEGRRVVASTARGPLVWDLDTGESRLFEVDERGYEVAVSPDGVYLAATVGTWGSTVRLWHLDTGDPVTTLSGFGRVSAIAFSPDGGRLAAAGYSLRLWDMDLVADTHAALCADPPRDLTEEEWAAYLPDLDYGSLTPCG